MNLMIDLHEVMRFQMCSSCKSQGVTIKGQILGGLRVHDVKSGNSAL